MAPVYLEGELLYKGFVAGLVFTFLLHCMTIGFSTALATGIFTEAIVQWKEEILQCNELKRE